MEQIKTFRETSSSKSVWLNAPVMKAAAPLIVATSIMIGQSQQNQISTNTGRMVTIEGTKNAWLKPISFLPEGNAMAKDVQGSNKNNDSYTFDPVDYGKLSQRVDSIDKKIDAIIASLDKLPTKDWVEKEMLKKQVDMINKSTNIRLTIAGIVVTIALAIINYFWK